MGKVCWTSNGWQCWLRAYKQLLLTSLAAAKSAWTGCSCRPRGACPSDRGNNFHPELHLHGLVAPVVWAALRFVSLLEGVQGNAYAILSAAGCIWVPNWAGSSTPAAHVP